MELQVEVDPSKGYNSGSIKPVEEASDEGTASCQALHLSAWVGAGLNRTRVRFRAAGAGGAKGGGGSGDGVL